MRFSFLLLLALTVFARAHAQKEVRIVTAGSAMTETVCALGDCEKIVASDRTSLYPAHIQTLPSIGYRNNISAEGIISLKPTLVIAEAGYVEDAVLQQIRSAGIKAIIVERVYDVEGTRRLIRTIGEGLSRQANGEALIATIESELAEAASIVKKSRVTPTVLCIYNRGASSVDIAGAKTFSAILPLVGAVPAISNVEGYKPLNAEALIASNPDYLLMFESGVKSLGGIDGVLKLPGVMQTTAGTAKQVVAMDGIKLSNFGPRLGEAAKELALSFHPDVKPN
jgi:iron complex transport system substrate-binding protein